MLRFVSFGDRFPRKSQPVELNRFVQSMGIDLSFNHPNFCLQLVGERAVVRRYVVLNDLLIDQRRDDETDYLLLVKSIDYIDLISGQRGRHLIVCFFVWFELKAFFVKFLMRNYFFPACFFFVILFCTYVPACSTGTRLCLLVLKLSFRTWQDLGKSSCREARTSFV